MTVEMSEREFNTTLAALRYYQNDVVENQLDSDVDPEGQINEIATDGGERLGLSQAEIDNFIERINTT